MSFLIISNAVEKLLKSIQRDLLYGSSCQKKDVSFEVGHSLARKEEWRTCFKNASNHKQIFSWKIVMEVCSGAQLFLEKDYCCVMRATMIGCPKTLGSPLVWGFIRLLNIGGINCSIELASVLE